MLLSRCGFSDPISKYPETQTVLAQGQAQANRVEIGVLCASSASGERWKHIHNVSGRNLPQDLDDLDIGVLNTIYQQRFLTKENPLVKRAPWKWFLLPRNSQSRRLQRRHGTSAAEMDIVLDAVPVLFIPEWLANRTLVASVYPTHSANTCKKPWGTIHFWRTPW